MLVIALGVAAIIAFTHLDWIVKWSIHRVFPGIRVEMKSLRVEFPSRLLVRDLELFSASDGELLLQMQGGTASFRLGELPRARIEMIALDHPSLIVSPRLGEALGIKPASEPSRESRNPFEWSIGRLEILDGRLRVTEFGERSPTVEMLVTATLENFGIGGEIGGIEHFVEAAKVSASAPSGAPFLAIDRIGARFTTNGLFAGDHIEAITIGKGHVEIAPELLDFFGGATQSSSSGQTSPSWTVGSLDLEGIDVNVPDAPGAIGRVTFHLAAALRHIGALDTSGGDAEQTVTASKIRVESPQPSAPPLLEADSAVATFSIAGLARRTLRDVRLENPSISIDLSTASDQPATTTPSSTINSEPLAWLIEHFTCNYGTLAVLGIRDGVTAGAKFAIDAANLGTLGEAATTAQKLTVWDVQLSDVDSETPILTLDVARIGFTPAGMLEHRIDSLDIEGGRLRVGEDLQTLFAGRDVSAPSSTSQSAGENEGWSIGTLRIAGIRTRIEDERPGLTELRFTLNTEFQNVSAAGLSGRLLDEEQTVEFADIILRSPLDREVKILSLRSVFVRFTLRGLSRKNLRKVVILRPSIFLNRDLFVYMERATVGDEANAADTDAGGDQPQWSVDELEVKFGKLVLGSGGDADVGLPLEFETTAQNIALDNLAALELQAVLTVPKQSYHFADYQLEIDDVEGDLRFAYPPEKGEKNLVQKLDIAGLRWRQFQAKDAWIAATFDVRGINGQFGGMSYDGYVNGGFSFFFTQDSPWIGWVAGTGIDTKSLTDVVSPQNFSMTGPLDFSVQVDAFRKNIDRVRGDIRVTEPGRLKIGKLDDLIARIPDTWTSVKQDITRIGLETLRDFDYTEATGDFWFVQSQGILNLDLSGPHGSRNFEIVLHDGQETDNPWQQGRLRAQSSPSPR